MEVDKIKITIKQAAQQLFRRYGYHKTSVNEIARKSRVAKATIYKYFESKEQILDTILIDYLNKRILNIIKNTPKGSTEYETLFTLVLKTCRFTYTACNEFIGWDFIKENVNSQQFLKDLSNHLEYILMNQFSHLYDFSDQANAHKRAGLSFLLTASKSIVFSFAFTSVTVSDVRKHFIGFERNILPRLVQAALQPEPQLS